MGAVRALQDNRPVREAHVQLLAGHKSSGKPVMEAVPAVALSEGNAFRLSATPGLAAGCAAGDVVRVSADGSFVVTHYGGNLGIQLLVEPSSGSVSFEHLVGRVESLGGYLDGGSDSPAGMVRVFTIPVTAGFAQIEEIFNAFSSEHPNATWAYANVYDPADGVTPLGWWE
jgi:hypothetical protein